MEGKDAVKDGVVAFSSLLNCLRVSLLGFSSFCLTLYRLPSEGILWNVQGPIVHARFLKTDVLNTCRVCMQDIFARACTRLKGQARDDRARASCKQMTCKTHYPTICIQDNLLTRAWPAGCFVQAECVARAKVSYIQPNNIFTLLFLN